MVFSQVAAKRKKKNWEKERGKKKGGASPSLRDNWGTHTGGKEKKKEKERKTNSAPSLSVSGRGTGEGGRRKGGIGLFPGPAGQKKRKKKKKGKNLYFPVIIIKEKGGR